LNSSKKNILFVSHDANRAGAQLFLLNIMKDFKAKGFGIHLLCLNKWGPLLANFEDLCEVLELPPKSSRKEMVLSKIFKSGGPKYFIKDSYSKKGIDLIYANTIATASAAFGIKEALDVPLIAHIHELSFSLSLYASKADKNNFLSSADGIIACSEAVRDNLVNGDPSLSEKTEVIHSFVDNERVLKLHEVSDKAEIKKEFGLPEKTLLAGACGNAEWRKGLDVFINLVNTVSRKALANPVHFVWIGLQPEGEYYDQIMYDVAKMGIEAYLTFIPPTPKAVEIINALDFFIVSSREDPFPLVMLEAALCQKPILGFKNTGGCSEFVKDEAGILANYLDTEGMAENLITLADNKALRRQKGLNGYNSILKTYSFEHSVEKLEVYLDKF
jgi:glycosyltransferase involved in cell wall biosynthesis